MTPNPHSVVTPNPNSVVGQKPSSEAGAHNLGPLVAHNLSLRDATPSGATNLRDAASLPPTEATRGTPPGGVPRTEAVPEGGGSLNGRRHLRKEAAAVSSSTPHDAAPPPACDSAICAMPGVVGRGEGVDARIVAAHARVVAGLTETDRLRGAHPPGINPKPGARLP